RHLLRRGAGHRGGAREGGEPRWHPGHGSGDDHGHDRARAVQGSRGPPDRPRQAAADVARLRNSVRSRRPNAGSVKARGGTEPVDEKFPTRHVSGLTNPSDKPKCRTPGFSGQAAARSGGVRSTTTWWIAWGKG